MDHTMLITIVILLVLVGILIYILNKPKPKPVKEGMVDSQKALLITGGALGGGLAMGSLALAAYLNRLNRIAAVV